MSSCFTYLAMIEYLQDESLATRSQVLTYQQGKQTNEDYHLRLRFYYETVMETDDRSTGCLERTNATPTKERPPV